MELQTNEERTSKQTALENIKIPPDRPRVRRKSPLASGILPLEKLMWKTMHINITFLPGSPSSFLSRLVPLTLGCRVAGLEEDGPRQWGGC